MLYALMCVFICPRTFGGNELWEKYTKTKMGRVISFNRQFGNSTNLVAIRMSSVAFKYRFFESLMTDIFESTMFGELRAPFDTAQTASASDDAESPRVDPGNSENAHTGKHSTVAGRL